MAKDWNFSITPGKVKLRPCMVDGKRALFHRWENYATLVGASLMVGGHPGGQISETYAIVEMEDGQVEEVRPSKVKFSDTREYIALIEGGDDGR